MEEKKSNATKNATIPMAIDPLIKSMAESIPQLLQLVDPENYQIQYINRLQPGFQLENILGVDFFNFVWPEHVELYKQKIKEVRETNIPATVEIVGASANNSEGKAWYRTQISIVNDLSNSCNWLMLLSEDITEQKLRENENINQGERIKAIINNTTDIICSIDCDYNIMEFNSILATKVKEGYGVTLKPGLALLKYIDQTKHDHLKAIYERVKIGETCYDIEQFDIGNNNFIHYESSYNPIYNIEKKIIGISIFSKNITERIKSEQKIKNALKEKEILLAEIHHRIKNNLAMVSSLLELQEMNINNVEARESLSSSRKRIKSTALIHELLYRSESFQNINLKDYVTELFQYLKSNENIQLSIKGNDINFNLNTALPLGLMLNEIMLNSFKHSYKDATEGKTEITTSVDGNILTIDYCDCKGEFPESIDFKNSTTTGLILIQTFAEQLNGSIELTCKTPPHYKIQLPINENQ